MHIKKISATGQEVSSSTGRPLAFSEFVGQEKTKRVMQAAVEASLQSNQSVGHILISGPSGFGKTTLSTIIAHRLQSGFKVITAYAISKPADMISLLNTLNEKDILFIDELHRLKPAVEEVLYIAMEDFCIDMVMPDGGSVRVPLSPFTLVGATTKLEALSSPLKNRFVYKFHLEKYTAQEKSRILSYYIAQQKISLNDTMLLERMCEHTLSVPREIVNFSIQLKDFLIAEQGQAPHNLSVNATSRDAYLQRSNRTSGGITGLQETYLDILREASGQPVGLKTLSVKLGIHEKSVENDVEPLLFELGKIEKTTRGRILL